MPHDAIPKPDHDFHDVVNAVSTFVTANAAAVGLTPDQVAPVTAAVAAWNTAYPAHKTASDSAIAACATKDQSRGVLETAIRPVIQQLQVSTKVTDAQRKTMKLRPRSKTRTPAGVPTSVPVATIDTSQRLRHILNYRDSVAGGRGKPAGVRSCEIWCKVGGPPPTDISQMTYLGDASKSPQLEEFTGAQAGLTVYYWLRWVNTRGVKGPWSEMISATIPG